MHCMYTYVELEAHMYKFSVVAHQYLQDLDIYQWYHVQVHSHCHNH